MGISTDWRVPNGRSSALSPTFASSPPFRMPSR
jgi:hypothetical protein